MHYVINRLLVLCLLLTTGSISAMEVPLRLQNSAWQLLEYSRIPANQVTETEQGLRIAIDASASPLIYLFEQPVEISRLMVTGQMGALPSIPPGSKQGDRGADDFPLRVGLVLEGDRTLKFAQRLVAAKWVRTLFDLAPADTGIDRILFLNLANPGEPGWQQREHPDGRGLFTETILKQVEAHQPFMVDYTLAMPKRVLALWISSDGDDTGSEYALNINSISYE